MVSKYMLAGILMLVLTQTSNAGETCTVTTVGHREYTHCNGVLVQVCETIGGRIYCRVTR
jgi:hypothetical protein